MRPGLLCCAFQGSEATQSTTGHHEALYGTSGTSAWTVGGSGDVSGK